MRLARHLARTGRGGGAFMVLVGDPEEMRLLGRPRLKWDDNIALDLHEVGRGTWTGFIWLRLGSGCGLL